LIFTTLGTLYFTHFTLISAFVAVPDWIWFVFIFAFGCCVGSFLNVVIYRLPRDKSIITPPSACPSCGKHIRSYDNIPLVSWLFLGAKCRYCKAPISPRYFIIELLTGSVFLGLFILYFRTVFLPDMRPFPAGGWLIYLLHIILLAGFIAASAIDLELWVIPLPICWFVTAVGLIGSASLVLLATGLIKRSYETEGGEQNPALPGYGTLRRDESEAEGIEDPAPPSATPRQVEDRSEQKFNHRLEACKEIIFLLPIIICSAAAYWIISERSWWAGFLQHPAIAGLLGSLWGYLIGCTIVWATRIFGTFAFGKEAMGLGDVHLMGAAGAVVGPLFVVMAFFIAPFFGLAWAGCQMFFKKIRQIPYGPFLSLGVLVVMILHDGIRDYIKFILEPLIGNW